MSALGTIYLESAIKRLMTYKYLGDKTFAQLEEEDFRYAPNDQSNSIAVIIRHMHGNMVSRWTNISATNPSPPSMPSTGNWPITRIM